MMASTLTPSKRRRNSITPNAAASKYVKIIPALFLCFERIRSSVASQLSSPLTPINQSAPIESSPTSSGPFSADTIANFLRHRCGSTDATTSPALWSYEGTLTDPMTGRVVAEVEGLELVKSLPMVEHSQHSDNQRSMMLENLSAKELLLPQSTSKRNPPWDAATTVLSRRLFCYRRPSSSHPKNYQDPNVTSSPSNSAKTNQPFSPYNSLLTSLHLRPDGPLRHLSPLENMAMYDSAITYISRNKGREMVVYSERGGRCGVRNEMEEDDIGRRNLFIMGSAETKQQSSSSSFDFAVRAQRGKLYGNSSGSNGPKLPPLKLFSQDRERSEDEVVISPPRSNFFQFGKGDGNGSSSERKYGSFRETYSYLFNDNTQEEGSEASPNKLKILGRIKDHIGKTSTAKEEALPPSQSQCSVRYTRYGEAPPWYAPGRSCTLELRGKRISLPSSIDVPNGNNNGRAANHRTLSQYLPPLPSWAATKCDFWPGWPSTFSHHKRQTSAEGNDLMRQYYQLPPESEMELARKALESFCREKPLSMGPLDDYPTPERKKWLSSAENALSKMQFCARKISRSFIISEQPRRL